MFQDSVFSHRRNWQDKLQEEVRVAQDKREGLAAISPLPFDPGTRLFDVMAYRRDGAIHAYFTFGSESHPRTLPDTDESLTLIAAYAANAQHVYGLAKQVQA